MEKYIIVVAGGRGTRMGGDVPKQFLPLAGKRVLMHTLERMAEAIPDAVLILALPHDQQDEWKRLCNTYGYMRRHRVVDGGETRFHTVTNALALVPEGALVAIHDGVRPLVSVDVVREAFAVAERCGAAIPVMPVVESLRCVEGEHSRAVDRSAYRAVQTPQVFDLDLIKGALKKAEKVGAELTDDCSAVEQMGMSVKMVSGDEKNIKVTTPMDLKIAEMLLEDEK